MAALLTLLLPLISSLPLLNNPTVGLLFLVNTFVSIAPIIANCSNCSGVQSAFAPKSSTQDEPFKLGKLLAIAGLSIPGRVLRTKREVAIKAPVLPALTQASASLVFTKFILTLIEESFLFLSALCGDSSIITT